MGETDISMVELCVRETDISMVELCVGEQALRPLRSLSPSVVFAHKQEATPPLQRNAVCSMCSCSWMNGGSCYIPGATNKYVGAGCLF